MWSTSEDANAIPLFLFGRIVFFVGGGGGAIELKRDKYTQNWGESRGKVCVY
jgi:hypothetical protein